MPRDKVIRIRMTDEEKEGIERQAAKNHVDLSAQIRMELRPLFERDQAENAHRGK